MKKFQKTLFFFLICITLNLYADKTQFCFQEVPRDAFLNKKNRTFFFTEPRSGTHWTFYILQYFSKRPLTHLWECDCYNLFDLDFSFEKPFIHHLHFYKELEEKKCFRYPKPNFKEDKILIIIRNPKECYLRGNPGIRTAIKTFVKNLKHNSNKLFENLKYLEEWPEENRYVFYYEDLINHPKEEISKLLDFIGEAKEDLDLFIHDIEHHRTRSLECYLFGHEPTCYKTDKDIKFHSKNYSKDQLIRFEKLMKLSYPYLWNKYLTRYEEE